MKMQEVQIKNFRSVTEVTIEFAPPCKALIGINESVKTNAQQGDSYAISQSSSLVVELLLNKVRLWK